MQSYDQFGGAGADQFHCRFGFVLRIYLPRAVVEVGELAAVDFDVVESVLLDGLFFGEANGPYWRMGEYDCWDVVVGHFCILEGGWSEETIREAAASGDGFMYVSIDRIDIGFVRSL